LYKTLASDQALLDIISEQNTCSQWQRRIVVLQFYCTYADACNKTAYNKTKVYFILLLFQFYCRCVGCL